MTKGHAPATLRNTQPIIDVLRKELPTAGTVLEIASGTGEHAVAFAQAFPDLTWQPSDRTADALPSIRAYREEAQLANLASPLVLDAAADRWPLDQADAIICINMVHISPWAATEGLFDGAGRLLSDGAPLIVYGPYREACVPLAPSNAAFDDSLKARNPEWGLRDVAALDELAGQSGLKRAARHAMPANNITLVYRRTKNARR